MADRDDKAGGGDRDAAIKVVRAAVASGRIVAADGEMRVEQLRAAQTRTELDLITRDLLPGGAGASVAPTPVAPLPQVNYGPAGTAAGAGGVAGAATPSLDTLVKASNVKIPKIAFLLPAIIGVAVIGAFAAGIFAFVNDAVETVGGGGPSNSQTYAPGVEPEDGVNVLSVRGYTDLLDALKAETGSTESFSAVLYPTYAVVELPVDGTTQRSDRFYWNGSDLESQHSLGTSTEERYDLEEVDPAVLVGLLKKVRSRVEAPTSWYAVIGAPDDDGAVLSVYASNAYSENAYLLATVDGTITYESTTPVAPTPEEPS